MLDFAQLSRIGFGCQRIQDRQAEHRQALLKAIDLGCNLIDTAATYGDGQAETVIGEVLSERPGQQTFVVSKAGYAVGPSETLLNELRADGRVRNDVVRTADGAKHSIHPQFLGACIQQSLRRLQRHWLDGFLLHDPEMYFSDTLGPTPTQKVYYERIHRAFEYLEELAAKGVVRYYGVSSDTLGLASDAPATCVTRLIEIAEKLSTHHHFRLVQFPFNLLEHHPAEKPLRGPSLIESIHRARMVAITNRPLNATSPSGSVRLATYDNEIGGMDQRKDQELWSAFVDLVERRLARIEVKQQAMEFIVMQILAYTRAHMANTDVVDQVFDTKLAPFLDQIFDGKVSEEARSLVTELRRVCTLYARRNMTLMASALRTRMTEEGALSANDKRSLSEVVCERYLRDGADHVLVGMRRTRYVEEMAPLFHYSHLASDEPRAAGAGN